MSAVGRNMSWGEVYARYNPRGEEALGSAVGPMGAIDVAVRPLTRDVRFSCNGTNVYVHVAPPAARLGVEKRTIFGVDVELSFTKVVVAGKELAMHDLNPGRATSPGG